MKRPSDMTHTIQPTPQRPGAVQGLSQVRQRTAFTVVELLIVMSIILLLLTFLFLGLNHITATARTRDTRTVLAQAKAMFDTYQQQTHLAKLPLGGPPAPQFWSSGTNAVSPIPGTPSPLALALPTERPSGKGDIGGDNRVDLVFTNPDGSANGTNDVKISGIALAQTIWVMNQLASIPENQTIISNLPTTRVKIFTLTVLAAQTSSLVPFAANPPNIIRGPVLLDSWGNPIIFIPSDGLANVTFSSQRDATNLLKLYTVTSTGKNSPTLVPSSPADQPFFMSAGPDGDLGLGDDNLYSFEN